jgi:hypothetical protein
MKMYKSTEQEVGKKDKKLKDIENSKSAANQRSAIDNLNRQLQDERKVAGFLILPPPPYTHTRTHTSPDNICLCAGSRQHAAERCASGAALPGRAREVH